MAVYTESYFNVKRETKFSHTDYVLLISTICGFSFILIGLLVILVGRRFRSQNSNNAADVELQSPDNGDEETRRLILKPSSIRREIHDVNNSTHGDLSTRPTADDYINLDIFENKEFDVVNDSTENEDQYNNLNEGLFKLMYPQLALYDLFNSPNHSPGKEKQKLLITEITNDEEMSIGNTNKIEVESSLASEKCSSFLFKSVPENPVNVTKPPIQPQLKINNRSLSEHDSCEDDKNTLSCDDSIHSSKPTEKDSSVTNKVQDDDDKDDCNSFFEREPNENACDIVRTSDDDTANQDQSPSSKLINIQSSDSSGLSDISNGFVEEPMLNNVVNKLLTIRSPSRCLKPLIKDIDNVNDEPNHLSNECHTGTTGERTVDVDIKMSTRVETLQKEISTFLQKSVNIDGIFENLIAPVDSQEDDNDDNNGKEDQLNEILPRDITDVIHFNPESSVGQAVNIESEVPNEVTDYFVKGAGDNIHQDDLLVDSPDTSTSTFWPDRNYQLSQDALVRRVTTSSESINNQTLSLSDERTFLLPNQTGSLLSINNIKIPADSMPIDVFGNKKNFDFSYTMESFRNDFGISDEVMDFGENSGSRLLEGISEENIDNVNKYDVDDSQSSVDNVADSKVDLQTNKNAFSESDSLNLKEKMIYRNRNVQETVKLFEDVASRSPNYDFKTPLRLHKKHK